jgi:YggT family protein
MLNIVVTFITIIYYAIIVLIFARVILSWVRVGSYEIREMIYRLTEPILAPVRNLLPATAGLDLSPMIVLILLSLIYRILIGALA